MRTQTQKAKLVNQDLKRVIEDTTKLWRKNHLTYDQTRYVVKEARKALSINAPKARKKVINRLSQDEEQRLIQQAYKDKGKYGLLIKTLFQTGARVSEFVNIEVEHVFFNEQMILIEKAKGDKSRYGPAGAFEQKGTVRGSITIGTPIMHAKLSTLSVPKKSD